MIFCLDLLTHASGIVLNGIDATFKTCCAWEKIYKEILLLKKKVYVQNFKRDKGVHFYITFVVQNCNVLLLKIFKNIFKKMFVAFNKTRYVARCGVQAVPPVQQYIPFLPQTN